MSEFWALLRDVLHNSGVVALLMVMALGGGGFLIRWLVKQLSAAQAEAAESAIEIARIHAEESEKRAKMREEHAQALNAQRRAHDEEIAGLHVERREQAERYAAALDALQEKRVSELSTLAERMVENATAIRHSMEQVRSVLDWLRDAMNRK